MKPLATAIAVSLFLPNAALCQNGKPNGADARPAPAKPAPVLDISKWPAFRGATLVQQVMMGGDQIRSLAGHVPAGVKSQFAKLESVQVLGYKLPGSAVTREIIRFYEPRILAAGYKVMVKDFSDDEEASAVYTGPQSGIVVLSIGREAKNEQTLEIVSVRGDLKAFTALKSLERKAPLSAPAPQPESPRPAEPKSAEPEQPTPAGG